MRKRDVAVAYHKAYWKKAIWLMAGITLLTLFAIQIWHLQVQVEHIAIAVAFSLVFCIWYTLLLKKLEGNGGNNAMRAFMLYVTIRLLAAIAIIGAYMVLTGLRGRQMMPFILLFAIYFLILDALDAIYMVKVTKSLTQEE